MSGHIDFVVLPTTRMQLDAQATEITRLRSVNAGLEEALAWYAKPNNWAYDRDSVSFAQADKGDRARAAIARVTEQKLLREQETR